VRFIAAILICASGLLAFAFPMAWIRRQEVKPPAVTLDPTHADMALIPGGSFDMGRSAAEIDKAMSIYGIRHRDVFAPESPRHQVRIDPLFMDKHEVTNAGFREFLTVNPEWSRSSLSPSAHNGHYLELWSGSTYPEGLNNHPVVFVTWHSAYAYCRWRGKRLPTEAEWEYAARGGRADPEFPWGDRPPDPGDANFSKSGFGAAIAVGRYPSNGYGLYDMAGNVWEFCLDEWDAGFYAKSGTANPVAGGPINDENYRAVKTRRVIRGGSWGASPLNLRVAYRDSHPPEGAGNHVGFRCACSR
jgi:formylglycine-generating enzyme required for sulfatase activity